MPYKNKETQREKNREYYYKNKEKRKKYHSEYYQQHKDERKEYNERYQKDYYQKNKTKKIEYRKLHEKENKIYNGGYYQKNKDSLIKKQGEYITNRIKTDINFKLIRSLRSRLRKAIKNNQKAGSAVRDLGCTIPELKTHLESKFQLGMTWKNWAWNGWHIDHIIPLDSFDLTNREEFIKACHYTNLQPLWAEENLKKKNKIIINSIEGD